MLNNIEKAIHRVVFYVGGIGMAVILLMMLLTTSDIIGRAFFTRPIRGSYEITQYMLVVIVLFGLAYAQQTGRNLRVSFFINKLPARGRFALDVVFTLAALGLFVLVTWQGVVGSLHAQSTNLVSDTLSIPTYPFEFLVAVGAFLLSLELLIKLIRTAISLKTGKADTVEMEGAE
jgi:TRAP-type C4-dicarboxylate transport system permease small subunit